MQPPSRSDAVASDLNPLIISSDEIGRRPTRAPDFELESRTLRRLSRTLTVAPSSLLQTMVNSLMEVCQAGSAGVSLLESSASKEGPKDKALQFRWVATGGGLAPFAGHTMPRDFSPCGTTLDTDQTLLMREPARQFPYINQLPMPICEVLLIPFRRDGAPIGTVWVAMHETDRHFDLEDVRLIGSISQFGAAATQVATNAAASDQAHKDLTEEHRRLAAADSEKGEFLATLTHEFRNVAAPLAAALEIIKRSEDRTMRTRAREMMERQVRQLNRLIDDLLDTSRLTTGKLRLDLQLVDIHELVRNAISAVEDRIKASGQTLVVNIPDEARWLRGDAVRLAQVFGNLLTNAAKYGREGGSVTVSAGIEGSYVVVSIRDTGVGIDSAMIPRIFDLFVQVEESLEKSQGGLGIGLALVRRLVELHGGKVEARSAGVNRGSEFLVYLPNKPQTPPRPDA